MLSMKPRYRNNIYRTPEYLFKRHMIDIIIASVGWIIFVSEYRQCRYHWNEALPPPHFQKRLPLTIQHFLLKIDICTSPLKLVSTTVTMVSTTLTMRHCSQPCRRNAYRLPYSIFYWKSIYLPQKLVSTTLTMVSTPLTMVSTPLTMRHFPENNNMNISIFYRINNIESTGL